MTFDRPFSRVRQGQILPSPHCQRGTGGDCPARGRLHDSSGFTLLEITIVVFILALMAVLVTPALHRFAGGDARSASRELTGLVSALVQDAVATHTIQRLYYDLDQREYWVTLLTPVGGVLEESQPVGVKRRLPSDVRFEDVVTAHQGLITSGTAFTQFFPSGAVTRTTIHLKDDADARYTVLVNPVTGRVAIKDGYIDVVGAS
ncbi:MAG TPA: prepilin-type N-terminal cleavage/methylation domain-containing protein [Nitrospiria bacterium]|nr:prepilin-type N-terminal cleavage/methylation domain-containing protein [Nitrospiria bacterium]